MKKLTLQFLSLTDLSCFSRTLNGGFFINTNNLTLTAKLSDLQINTALELYNASVIETTEKVYSYDLLT